MITDGPHVGVLISRGDLLLAGAAHLRGRVLVDGALTLRDSARIEGTVDVTGAVIVADAARIEGDRCAVVEAWRDGVADQAGRLALDAYPWPLWGPPP